MLKKICCSFFTLLTLTVFFSCSRFDESTGLGKDIIKDIDPSLTDVSQNFKIVEITEEAVSAFSIYADNNDFGIHTGALSVGTKDSVTASGYVEYTIGSTTWDRFGLEENSVFNIDSISLQFNVRLKESTLPTKLHIYASTDEDKNSRSNDAKQFHIATLNLNDSSSYSGLADSTLIDSVETAFSNFRNKIKDCGTQTCKDSIKAEIFRFSIYSDDSCNLVHLSTSPTMKIFARKDTDTNKVITTVVINPTYINFVAVESNIESLSNKPISSFASQRIAVFKLDISDLWNEMDNTKLDQILSTGFSITPKVLKNMDFSNGQQDTLAVVYFLSDKLIDNNTTFQDQKVRAIRKIFSSGSTEELTDTLHLKNLEEHYRALTSKPSMVYLYLQLSSGFGLHWKEVQWNNPKFKAILSTLK